MPDCDREGPISLSTPHTNDSFLDYLILFHVVFFLLFFLVSVIVSIPGHLVYTLAWLACRGSAIRFHLLWRTVELAVSTRLCFYSDKFDFLCFRFDALTELGAFMRTEFLCISVLRVASGPRVELASCKRALTPSPPPPPPRWFTLLTVLRQWPWY